MQQVKQAASERKYTHMIPHIAPTLDPEEGSASKGLRNKRRKGVFNLKSELFWLEVLTVSAGNKPNDSIICLKLPAVSRILRELGKFPVILIGLLSFSQSEGEDFTLLVLLAMNVLCCDTITV